MRLGLSLLLLTVMNWSALFAQDAHFSQFFAAPYQLNPALTGVFNGKMRVNSLYREQWKSFLGQQAFKTYTVGGDLRLPVGKKDYYGLGLKLLRDEAGAGRYAQNSAHLSGSFIKQLSGNGRADHYLVAGGDLGMGQNTISWGDLWFSRQYDAINEIPDPSLPSQENFNDNTVAWLDGSAGLLWYALYDDEGFIYGGASLHHINQPNISLIGNARETMYRRWSAHAGGLIPLTRSLGLAPAVWYTKQGPSMMTDLGTNVRYTNHDRNELTLRAGTFARVANKYGKKTTVDAMIVVGMVEVNNMQVGLSYDINISKLANASNSRGAFEMSAQYIWPEERRKKKVKCPKL